MNTDKRIEHYLKAAPKLLVPDGLLDKLQDDVTLREAKTQRSVLRTWLSSGGSISPWRIAAVVAIALMVLLPLTYAGGKVIKSYVLKETIAVIEEVRMDDGSITKVGTLEVVTVAPDEPPNVEEIREMEELKKVGRFEKEFVKEWTKDGMTFHLYKVSYTLSNGKVVTRNEIEAGSDN